MKRFLLSFIIVFSIVFSIEGRVFAGEPHFYGQNVLNVPFTFEDAVYFTDGTDISVIKHIQETGLGGRLTIGLDETARTMVICDYGDVDTDFGLSTSSDPKLYVYDNGASTRASLTKDTLEFSYTGNLFVGNQFQVSLRSEMSASDPIKLTHGGNSITDTDGEQSWVIIEPKINQSSTAAYNALKIDVTETGTGDGSTGDGNNLIRACVGGSTVFKVSDEGMMGTAPETVTCASDAGTASVNVRTSFIVTDGGSDTNEDTVSLADGTVGDEKVFVYLTETDVGDSANVTPATALGFSKIVFDAPGEGCMMVFTASGWAIFSNNGGTIS